MTNITVIGAQWGDEGKGKVVDWLCQSADVGVRFQGGHNAGHTMVVNGKARQLSLLPASILRSGKLSVIGNGAVIDPWALLDEIDAVRQGGIEAEPEQLMIADNAVLVLPLHKELDAFRESGAGSIGTTGRGIGPAYEDKVARRALRLCDLASQPDQLGQKVNRLLEHHNPLRHGLGLAVYEPGAIISSLMDIAPRILPYSGTAWQRLYQLSQVRDLRIVFEGAQGVMLDLDHGTYPFVTSSNTVAGQAAVGCGMGTGDIGSVLGVCKAYATRVGLGPFPTEQNNQIGDHLRERGGEYGTVTKRPRRCGWFDAVLARQAVRLSGLGGIALTKLDVLDRLEQIEICVGYLYDGQRLDYFPAGAEDQQHLEPIYESTPGWRTSTQGKRLWSQLPKLAVSYIRRIEELIGSTITLVSTGPERQDMIVLHDPFS